MCQFLHPQTERGDAAASAPPSHAITCQFLPILVPSIRLGIPSEDKRMDMADSSLLPLLSWTVESRRLLSRLRGKILRFFLAFPRYKRHRRRPFLPPNPFSFYDTQPPPSFPLRVLEETVKIYSDGRVPQLAFLQSRSLSLSHMCRYSKTNRTPTDAGAGTER